MRTAMLSMIFVTMLASSALAQERVGVFPVEGTNISPEEGIAIGMLIAASYSDQVHAPVLSPNETAAAAAQQLSKPDAARQLGLTQYITVQCVRLNTKMTVRAELHNVHGSTLYQVRTVAMSLDDMEQVSDRVASSLYRRTPLEYTQTIDNVTGKEMRAPNRMFAEKVFGLRTAVVMPFASGLDPTAGLLAEFDGRLEGTSYFLEFGAGFMIPSDLDDNYDDDNATVGALMAHLGGSYYLSNSTVAPYLGGGVSPRIMFGDYSGAGFTVLGKVGLMFMRQSSSRLYVEVEVDQNLLPLSRDYDYYDNEVWNPDTMMYEATDRPDDSDVLPTELSLAVGIGW